MITLKNTDVQTLYWWTLPKFSNNINEAIAKGTLAGQSQTTIDTPTTVNVLLALNKREFAALGIASEGTTVTFINDGPGTYCTVL